MQEPTKWRAREPLKREPEKGSEKSLSETVSGLEKELEIASPIHKDSPVEGFDRSRTFVVDGKRMKWDWDLVQAILDRKPIPVDPIALNKARSLCRLAMTLITREVSLLRRIVPLHARADISVSIG